MRFTFKKSEVCTHRIFFFLKIMYQLATVLFYFAEPGKWKQKPLVEQRQSSIRVYEEENLCGLKASLETLYLLEHR